LPPIKILTIGDSAKLYTGFGVVMAQLNMGFHEAGFDVHALGLLDHDPDDEGKLPYNFYAVPFMDDLAHNTYGFVIRSVKPDIIFILSDPGNAFMYTWGMVDKQHARQVRNGVEYYPPVVLYTPIEGWPVPLDHLRGFEILKKLRGSLVVYCESARRLIRQAGISDDYVINVVNHGLDHANFRRYSEEDRHILRQLVGLDKKFVIGSIGVNKRTKGFPTLIYAARWLRELDEDQDVVFYLHTNPDDATMFGHPIRQMAKIYGVEDMFLWKPKVDKKASYWTGVERDLGTLEQARCIAGQVPDTAEGRGLIFATYDFEAILNCMDLYVDTSQNEGWGLPLGEAMKAGIPCITVHDKHVRDEVYEGGAYFVDSLDTDCWETWHTGQRLVTMSPKKVAEAIIEMKHNPAKCEQYAAMGQVVADKYKWQPAKEEMTKIVQETHDCYVSSLQS